ncbi:MAG TPA: hypothetical protein DDZ67_00830 [Xanthomonadaceae bacterium]|nr:hypothetical protein [Xanthomonadaceae bacterium]
MRVMIHGGAGFIGTSVAERLRSLGDEVVIADRASRLARSGEEIRRYTCVDLGAGRIDYSGIDALIYLSSATLPATSMGSLSYDAEANIAPSLRIMEDAAEAGVPQVVFASSGGTVYGKATVLPIRETHPTHPLSAYGVSKLALERYLEILGRQSGVRTVSLRIANPYGPNQFRGAGVGAIAQFMHLISQGQAIHVWGDGSVVRDYLHVDDVADAFIAVCHAPVLDAGQYNVGSGGGVSLNELIDRIMRISGARCEIIYEDARSFDVPAVALDSGKLHDAVGWHPRIDLDRGLGQMWALLGK